MPDRHDTEPSPAGPVLTRAHLQAARVGHEAARTFRHILGGLEGTQDVRPWRQLPEEQKRRLAARVAELDDRKGRTFEIGHAPKPGHRNVADLAASLALVELREHPHADRPL